MILMTGLVLSLQACDQISSQAISEPNSGSLSEQFYQSESPVVRELTPAEIDVRERQAEERADRYAERLQTAPSYRSETRSHLVGNRDAYQWNFATHLFSVDFRDHDFKCVHSAKIIENAQADQWELVRCDSFSLTFLRPHQRSTEPHPNCQRRKRLGDEYELLRLYVGEDYPAVTKKTSQQKYSSIIGGPGGINLTSGNPHVPDEIAQIIFGHETPQDVTISARATSNGHRASVLNRNINILANYFIEEKGARERDMRVYSHIGDFPIFLQTPKVKFDDAINLAKRYDSYFQSGQ